MAIPATNFIQSPFTTALPSPIVFRSASLPADAVYPLHRHPWGEFVYSFSGVMEVRIGGRHYLAPSQYGLWLPPQLEHQGLNRYATCHCSLYVDTPDCARFPQTPCALLLNPLIGALLEHLRQQPLTLPYPAETQRLLQVLVDQLAQAPISGSFLPTSLDPLLGPLLRQLEANPGDNRSLAELAGTMHTSERTLMRRCQRDLGMSLADWRQRLRVIRAMPRLEAGEKVESIALDLGYGSASAFIAMFRRLMQTTPDEYRRSRLGRQA